MSFLPDSFCSTPTNKALYIGGLGAAGYLITKSPIGGLAGAGLAWYFCQLKQASMDQPGPYDSLGVENPTTINRVTTAPAYNSGLPSGKFNLGNDMLYPVFPNKFDIADSKYFNSW